MKVYAGIDLHSSNSYIGLRFRHYRVPGQAKSAGRGGYSHSATWKEAKFGFLVETYCGMCIYWDV